MGFELSCPEIDFSGITDRCLEKDIYLHLDRQGEPSKLFNKFHDIYALDVVLLEICNYPRCLAESNFLMRHRLVATRYSSLQDWIQLCKRSSRYQNSLFSPGREAFRF